MRSQDWIGLLGLLATAITGGVFIGQLLASVERLEEQIGVDGSGVRVERGRVRMEAPGPAPEDGLERGVGAGQVTFTTAFDTAPTVYIALNSLDIHKDFNTRINVTVGRVDPAGFTYRFVTFSDTRVIEATANWIAIAQPTQD